MGPLEILKKYWGYDRFRPLQDEIIDAVISNHDVLALLPTGGGKSICYQVPGLTREGLTLVISPLIALMKDQVENLQTRGIRAAGVYSGLTPREIDITLDNCVYGDVKFLYISPERLQTELFLERVRNMNVSLIAVDEAHCISQWGYDFRPPYLQIASFRKHIPDCNMIAVTATATKRVQEDIIDKLQLSEVKQFQKSFARANLSYSVRKVENKEGKLLEVLQRVKGSAVVYCSTRRRTKELAEFLGKNNLSADFYHGGLETEERNTRQQNWMAGVTDIIVSTNAFGMGIDKPDVRVVVHMDLPLNIESYYQEAGRAGRDEKKAYAVIIYQEKDLDDLKQKSEASFPDLDFIRKVYQAIANYYQLATGSHAFQSFDFEVAEFSKRYQFDLIKTLNALKVLSEADLIGLSDGFYQPSKVHIIPDNKNLYQFQVAHPKFDSFIKGLLRIYGGELFARYVPVSETLVSNKVQLKEGEVRENLIRLTKLKILDYVPRKNKPQLTLLKPRISKEQLKFDQQKIGSRRKIELEKMESMIAYVKNSVRCRTQLLLEYFGEISYQPCGVCDYCVSKNHKPDDAFKKLSHKIIEQLQNGPKSIDILVSNLNTNKDQLIEVLRIMMDDDILKKDMKGNLIMKKAK